MIAPELRSVHLQWYYDNKEHVMAMQKERRKKLRSLKPLKAKVTPKQKKESKRLYYLANRTTILANVRRRFLRIKGDPVVAANHSSYVNRSLAAKKSSIHPGSDRAEEKKLFIEANRLTTLTGKRHEIDHIIPLIVGGVHHHLNMQILPASLNRQKACDPFWEGPGFKSWRDVPRFLWPPKLVPSYLALSKGDVVSLTCPPDFT